VSAPIKKIPVPVLVAAMTEAGGDCGVAAAALGITRVCLQQKLYRAGMTRRAIFQAMDDSVLTTAGDVVLSPTGNVCLSLADYTLLQSRAAMAAETERLQHALIVADRIIDVLTRAVEAQGAP
jgi:hypothetical protein